MAWVFLTGILLLPWFSLLLSLPSILMTKVDLLCPERVPLNSEVSVKLNPRCPLPIPPIQWSFQAHENFSNNRLTFSGNASFLADHCGTIKISTKSAYIYDYLGLIPLPMFKKGTKSILIIPTPLPLKALPSLKRYLASNWKPKPGGGFSENYDLREYVPGDDPMDDGDEE